MEIIQFVMQFNVVNKKDLPIEEKIEHIKKMIHVRDYVPIREKEKMIKNLLLDSIIVDNGRLKVSYFEKDLKAIMLLIKTYTDLNINEDGYDILCKNNLLEYVISSFGKEYEICIGIMNTYMADLEAERVSLEDLRYE